MKKSILLILLLFIGNSAVFSQSDRQFTESFNTDNCTFLANGRNTFFILEPGYQLSLKGMEGNDSVTLVITVLNETKRIGSVETRIVEEHESTNGELVEISRNYFAICKETGSIFYFGEEVDIYEDGKIVSHSGAWTAEGKNKPGIMMPGQSLIGSRYYQEIAPGIAMDRAEIISITETMITPAGEFSNVLITEETTPLEPEEKSYKLYAPGVGLIKDGNLLLVKYVFEDLK